MNSGKRMLVKVLVAVVSYGVVFTLAIYAINQFFNLTFPRRIGMPGGWACPI